MRASWVEGALILTGAIVGWYTTRRWRIGTTPTPARPPSSDYLAGLNSLVNEQPDRAVEAFLRAVAVDRDTVETQFALGALFLVLVHHLTDAGWSVGIRRFNEHLASLLRWPLTDVEKVANTKPDTRAMGSKRMNKLQDRRRSITAPAAAR